MAKHTPASKQRRLVDLWHVSELSMAGFAREHGIRPGTFATWVSRYRTPPPPGAFLRLAARAEGTRQIDHEPEPLAVRLGERLLRFDAPPPPSWFAAVLRELGPC